MLLILSLLGKFRTVFIWAGIILLFLSAACDSNYVPKPRGYFRIDLPEKEYQKFDTTFPYSFEYPVYANINYDLSEKAEPYWLNIDFPLFKGRLHLSYKKVDGNLINLMEDTRTMVIKHIPKASAIHNTLIEDPSDNIYGMTYQIKGMGAASPFQFFVTDSSRHFVRGALYFSVKPNNDSLKPVIDFVREDIDHMLETWHWKNAKNNVR